jgi:hypothetical protein
MKDNDNIIGKQLGSRAVATYYKPKTEKKKTGKKPDLKKITEKVTGIENIAKATISRVEMTEDVLNNNPEIMIASELAVISIISPNTLASQNNANIDINYNLLPHRIKEIMRLYIDNRINNTYKLDKKLYKIIDTALIKKGAYIEVFINQNNIQDIMNEKAPKESITLENILEQVLPVHKDNNSSNAISNLIDVRDGTDVLYYKDKFESANESLEIVKSFDNGNLDINDIMNLDKAFKSLNKDQLENGNIEVKENNDSLKLPPLNMVIPTEATIPLANPNDPSDHYGYFILLDADYNPITKLESTVDDPNMAPFIELNKNLKAQSDMVYEILTPSSEARLAQLKVESRYIVDRCKHMIHRVSLIKYREMLNTITIPLDIEDIGW